MSDETEEAIGEEEVEVVGWKMPRSEVLEHAIQIANSYRGQGLTLTLRQLYYRFVATGIAPSGQAVYNKIGSTLTNARYDGTFPIELLEDRGRSVGLGDYSRYTDRQHLARLEDEGAQILGAIPDWLVKRDRWYGQKTHVSVWVEKQALEGVFGSVCSSLGVGLFACKGYPSVSSLYDYALDAYFAIHGPHDVSRRSKKEEREWSFGHGFNWTEFHKGHAERAVVLYFGDHDPDGWEIPRSARRGVGKIMDVYELEFPLEFRRVALNMDQIQQYNPPPFEAKMTSARYRSYRDEHDTDEAWELDALDPAVLQQLIRDNIAPFFDENIHRNNQDLVKQLRLELRERMGLGEEE